MNKIVLEICLISLLVFSGFTYTESPLCTVCMKGTQGVNFVVKHLIPNSVAAQFLSILCIRKYDSQELCKKVGQEIAPIAIENLIKNYLNPDHVCSYLCGKIYKRYNPDEEVNRILNNNEDNQNVNLEINLEKFVSRKSVVKASSHLNILHLSDIHLDQHYTQKASISCSYPICCHPEHGFPENPSAQAKPLGSKNCDSPPKLLDSLLQSLSNITEEIDVVIATGDFSAHDQWEKTAQSIDQNDRLIQQKIQDSPKLRDSIFIRAQGNNDYSPDHQYDGSNNQQKNKLVSVVSIQNEEGQSVAFISLNTIVYDNNNLFLLGDQSYAIFQLMILQKQLKTYDKVYILGHIPQSLDQTAIEYAKVFRALIAKYSSKIAGQFFGHTHSDQLAINTYPSNPQIITGFSFITPSVSPYNVNKSKYRIYKITNGYQSQYGVIDYSQFMLKDLNQSVGEWVIDYTFKQKYKISKSDDETITKQDIQKIVKNIMDQSEVRRTYIRSTGYDENELTSYTYCQIFDDPIERNKCMKKGSSSFSSKLYQIMDILRGKWGFDLQNTKQN